MPTDAPSQRPLFCREWPSANQKTPPGGRGCKVGSWGGGGGLSGQPTFPANDRLTGALKAQLTCFKVEPGLWGNSLGGCGGWGVGSGCTRLRLRPPPGLAPPLPSPALLPLRPLSWEQLLNYSHAPGPLSGSASGAPILGHLVSSSDSLWLVGRSLASLIIINLND